MVSIKDISAACGVSVATVSKALNNQKDVSEATKARIKETARQMGYVPNSASRSLKIRHTYNLGIIYDEDTGSGLKHDFFAHVLESFKNYAEQHGYDITFVNNRSLGDSNMTYLERCRYRNFDGVILACTDFDNEQILEVLASEIPAVTIDFHYHGRSSVMSDNAGGIADLVRYAHEFGHNRITYIHGTDSFVTRTRINSFISTCNELNIGIPRGYLIEAAYRDSYAAYMATDKLLALDERPTCILYPDDMASIGGLNAIRRAGLKVPDDISICGYDGVEYAHYYDPPLTTLNQDRDTLGKEAAAILIEQIEKKNRYTPKNILVPGRIFGGGTVGQNRAK